MGSQQIQEKPESEVSGEGTQSRASSHTSPFHPSPKAHSVRSRARGIGTLRPVPSLTEAGLSAGGLTLLVPESLNSTQRHLDVLITSRISCHDALNFTTALWEILQKLSGKNQELFMTSLLSKGQKSLRGPSNCLNRSTKGNALKVGGYK